MSAGSGASGGPDDGGDADDAPADATEREATAPTAGADVAAPSTSKQRRSKKHKRKKHKAKAGSRSGATDEASVEIGPLPDWEEVVTPDGVRYFYNHATGVSQFEEPADEAFQPATKLTKEFRSADAAGKASVSRDGNSDYGDGGSKVEGEGDETSLLDDIEVDVGGSVQRSRTSSDKVVKLFFIQSMCHAFICEAPMVVVEVVIRVPLDLLAAFVVALGACVARNAAWGQRASGFALDALLLLLIGVTAVVPGGILTAYRNFSAEDDTWDLTPIVTLLGNADPRRSIVIRHGQGEWAANADPPGRDELGRRVYDMDMLCGVPLAPPPVEIGVANDSDLEYGLSSGDDDGRGSDAGRSQELHTAA